MFNISVCCNNLNQINNLNNHLNNFSSCNNFKFNISWFGSLDHLASNPPREVDILLLYIKLDYKELVLNIDKMIKTMFGKIEVIYVVDIMDFTLNGYYLKNLKSLLLPIKYPSLEEELLNCINDLLNNSDSLELLNCINDLLNNSDSLDDISTKDILFIESLKNKSIIHYEKRSVEVNFKFKLIEKSIDSNVFFKCHNNYLINLSKINKISKTSITIGDNIIPIAKNKFLPLKNILLNMLDIK